MKGPLVLFDFSGVYGEQSFWRERQPVQVKCSGISGTNCYCDWDARKGLENFMEKLPLEGIHFLDSGNYHYMTRLWLDKMKEPFRLLVLDHHTDMQPPAFGGLLSCGGWVEDALENLPLLTQVWIAGPPRKDLERDAARYGDRVQSLPEEEMKVPGSLDTFLDSIPADQPLYLSIDKDVLSCRDVVCNWSQGSLSLDGLLDGLDRLWKRAGNKIRSVDICGESGQDAPQEYHEQSSRVNERLLAFLEKRAEGQENVQ